VTDKSFLDSLKKATKNRKAKYPVSVSVLEKIPHFTETFSDDEKIIKSVSQLESENGTAYIRYKTFKANEIILKKGKTGKTVFWLMNGALQVKTEKKVLAIIKPISCFGELSVVNSQDRNATVQVTDQGPAEVLEIDWSVTKLQKPLADRFQELLLRNSTEKLKAGYMVSERLWKSANNLLASANQKIKKLEKENEKLRALNESLNAKLKKAK